MNRIAKPAGIRRIAGHRTSWLLLASMLAHGGCASILTTPSTGRPGHTAYRPAPPSEDRLRPVEIPASPDLGMPQPLSPSQTSELPGDAPTEPRQPVEMLAGPELPQPLRAEESQSGPRIIPQQIFVPARLQLSVKAPEQKQVGSGATYVLTVRNMGDDPVDDTVVTCAFDEALVFSGHREHKVRQTLGRLAPGEHKELPLSLTAATPGRHCCRFEAVAAGLEPMMADACVEFVPRQLGVSLRGPAERTVGDRAEFMLNITNLTSAPIRSIRVRLFYDGALDPGKATPAAEERTGSYGWTIPELAPGESMPLQAELVCSHLSVQSCLIAEIRAEGMPDDEVEACLAVRSPTRPLAVQIEDTVDAVRVSETTEYLITVRNRGFEPLRNIALSAEIPPLFRVVEADVKLGPRLLESSAEVSGQKLHVSPVDELHPDAALTYRIRVKALTPGTGELIIRITGPQADEPLTTTETTTVIVPSAK